MVKKIILWFAVIGMSAVIFGFSSGTGEQSSGMSEKIAESIVENIEEIIEIDINERASLFETIHLIVRKGAHFSEFAILGILSFMLAGSYGFSVNVCTVSALLYCLIFAACDEIHQLFVDGRAGRITDVFIDFAGSFVGVVLCRLLCCKKSKKKTQY